MTNRLDKVIEQIRELPEPDQDLLAAILQAELEDNERWHQKFATTQDQLSNLAAKARADIRAQPIETTYEHIIVDDNDIAWIENANIKLVELVLERQAHGGTPEEIQAQHPTLTLGQIYSAFAYYEDHRQQVDAEIEWRWQRVEEIKRETPEPPVLERLRRAKRDGSPEC